MYKPILLLSIMTSEMHNRAVA